MDVTWFVYPAIKWKLSGLYPGFGDWEKKCADHSRIGFSVPPKFHVSWVNIKG